MGPIFTMGKLYFAGTTTGEPLFLEPLIDGKFTKYVNNNGKCFSANNGTEVQKERQEKAETLLHYSYYRSDKFSMVLDIHDCGCTLTDPEVATNWWLKKSSLNLIRNVTKYLV